jgi:hypothetical protein
MAGSDREGVDGNPSLCRTCRYARWSMIRKSGNRFSEKIMLKQGDEIMMRFNLIAS